MPTASDSLPTVEKGPWLRAAWQYTFGWGTTFIMASSIGVVTAITFGRFSDRLVPWFMRTWGGYILWVMGVKLDVEGAEHLKGRQMRVVSFNHTSNLDAMIIPTLNPAGSVQAIKRSALYIPFVGLSLYLMGALLLDRGRSDKAKRSLQKAADRMKDEQLTVFIAPEGTRSVDGSLQPFKKGAFHLARSAQATITPVVIDGAYDLYPKHRATSLPGVVRVRILPPFDWRAAGLTTADEMAEALGEIYTRTIREMRAQRPTS